jgi:hypothetical protein
MVADWKQQHIFAMVRHKVKPRPMTETCRNYSLHDGIIRGVKSENIARRVKTNYIYACQPGAPLMKAGSNNKSLLTGSHLVYCVTQGETTSAD